VANTAKKEEQKITEAKSPDHFSFKNMKRNKGGRKNMVINI
jgi:hypothetical protein